jgi:hypothetical protein
VFTPNVVVERFTLLLHIRDVRVSNLGSETGYRDRGFVVFLSPFRKMPG